MIGKTQQNAWKAIAKEVKIDATEAQARYHASRTRFSHYLKSIRAIRSGSGQRDVELKEEYEHLRWLISHIKHRPTISNSKRTRQEEVSDDDEDQKFGLAGNVTSAQQNGNGIGDGSSEEEGVADSDVGKEENVAQDGIDDHNSSKDEDETVLRLVKPKKCKPLKASVSKTTKPKEYQKNLKTDKGKSKRPWSADKLNTFEKVVLDTMGDINGKFKSGETEDQPLNQDEISLFRLSLASKLKRLPSTLVTKTQLQILQVVCDVETMADSLVFNKSSYLAPQFPNWTPTFSHSQRRDLTNHNSISLGPSGTFHHMQSASRANIGHQAFSQFNHPVTQQSHSATEVESFEKLDLPNTPLHSSSF